MFRHAEKAGEYAIFAVSETPYRSRGAIILSSREVETIDPLELHPLTSKFSTHDIARIRLAQAIPSSSPPSSLLPFDHLHPTQIGDMGLHQGWRQEQLFQAWAPLFYQTHHKNKRKSTRSEIVKTSREIEIHLTGSNGFQSMVCTEHESSYSKAIQ